MIRGTTPTIVLKIDGVNAEDVENVVVTFKERNGVEINKESTISEDGKVSVSLTSSETLKFTVGNIEIQAKILFNNGKIMATNIAKTTVGELLSEVGLL